MSALDEAWTYLLGHPEEVAGWFWWHAWLSVAPVLAAVVVAVPLGHWVHRRRRAGAVVLAGASALYTVPSLALFVLLPAVLGTKVFDPLNVVVALGLYAVALLVRVVADGLDAVPVHVTDAATAMGYGTVRQLLLVQLPLATPVLVQGLRVALVSNVSIVPVASLLGIDQLGQLFTVGLQTFATGPIVLGIAGCLVLAVTLDALLVLAGRAATPWLRAGGAP